LVDPNHPTVPTALTEMKFPSFPDLIKAITADVSNAKDSLDIHPYSTFGAFDPFLNDNGEPWVGTAGGDDVASYEVESTIQFLSKIDVDK